MYFLKRRHLSYISTCGTVFFLAAATAPTSVSSGLKPGNICLNKRPRGPSGRNGASAWTYHTVGDEANIRYFNRKRGLEPCLSKNESNTSMEGGKSTWPADEIVFLYPFMFHFFNCKSVFIKNTSGSPVYLPDKRPSAKGLYPMGDTLSSRQVSRRPESTGCRDNRLNWTWKNMQTQRHKLWIL